nr:type III secretion protein HrpB4 [Robbsia betulipollinis]
MLSRVSTRDDSWIWLREALLPPRLGPVPPLAFVNAGERLGVAEPVLLRRALAVRALYARRSAVRRCIDRALLDQMRAAVGAQTLDALRRVAATDGETTLPLPEMLDAASLAQEGLWRLRRESAIAIPAIVSLVAMQLDGAAAPDGYPCEPGGSGERARFFARLPLLIPELP